MVIRLVTDSGSMLPADLAARLDVDIVPMVVLIDDGLYREGVDLTNSEFYGRLGNGAKATTSAPSPGDFLTAYRRVADEGATRIVSVHTGSAYSATVGSATLAAAMSSIPVDVVDTGLASFLVGLCVWSAAEALAEPMHDRDDDVDVAVAAAVRAAQATAASAGSVFVVGAPTMARDGGRFGGVAADLTETAVLELAPTGMSVLATLASIDLALDAMVAHVAALAETVRLRVAVGDADRSVLADTLMTRLRDATDLADIVRYEVGPSVGAHTGAGSIGIVYCAIGAGGGCR